MIDRELAPVRLGVPGDYGEILQALMLTYLSQYNVTGPSVNTQQAYRRAFGVTDLQSYARVLAGRPGYMLFKIPYPWGNHVIIAIEGMRSRTQLWDYRQGVESVLSTDGLPGKVWNVVKTHSDTVWGELAVNAWFQGLLTQPTTQLTFAGHSLGSAMASVLAARFKKARPAQIIRVRKTGAMRYCDQAWLDGYSADIDTVAFYTDHDPVVVIPASGAAAVNFGALGAVPYWGTMLTVERGIFCSLSGEFHDWQLRNLGLRAVDVYAMSLQALDDPRNYWKYHFMIAYRLAAMNIAARNRDLLEMRINYLEHNEENQWQVRFRPRTAPDETWNVLADPAPPAFAAWTGEQLRLHGQGVPQPAVPPGDSDPIGGGGDEDALWGMPGSLTSARRRRAQHTPIVR